MTKHQAQTADRKVTVPMMMRAAETLPASYREDDNSIEVVWTTGAAVTRFDWWDGEYYDETLSLDDGAVRLDRLNAGAPFLDSHDDWALAAVLGSVEPGSARIDGGQGVARVRLSAAGDVANQVLKIREGHVRNVSVGYAVHAYEVIEASASGSGRKEMRAVDWEPMEISAVAIPADPGSQVRAKRSQQGGFPCTVRGAAASHEEKTMTEKTGRADDKTTADDTIKTETRDAPAGLTTTAIMERAKPLGAMFALDLVERHAKTPMSELDLERAINDHYAEKHKVPEIDNAITVQRDADDKYVEGAMHGLIARAGLSSLVEKAARARGETGFRITPGEFRGIRMATLAAESLTRAGVKVDTRNEGAVVEMALRHAAQTRAAIITQTTSDFAIVLESTMNKVVQAAYATAPDSWRLWCKVGSVTDFRDQNRYLLGSFGALDTVNEAGEIKNKPIPDGAREKIRAGTKGNIINLSRNAIINDDLGAFSELATQLGRAAKLSIEVDAYALLNSNPTMSDGVALFHASHGNLRTAAAPTVASIDDARMAMASQKDISGNEFLDIRPALWLGPLSLGSAVRVINDSPYDPDATNKLQRPNPVSKIFDQVVDTPRLTGTAWYAFADPDQNPAFEVVFLNGDEEPKVDSQDGWRSLGVEWRVIHDYGIGAINYRAVQKNPGA